MMFVGCNIHTDHKTEYDVTSLGGDTLTVKLRGEGGDATLFFRSRMELDRFVSTVTDRADALDEEPDREPSAAQEHAWNWRYDGTSLGA